MKKLIDKILTAISIMLGECQCPCHELGYNSCSLCMNKHNMKIKNDGVLLGDHPDTYRAGATKGALPYEIRNESGDWESVLPPEERQSNDGGDSMSCVTFAELNGIESQEFSFLKALNVPNATEYSDRWIAKMSGTTKEGNYLWKVADAIRKFGLVKEESYPRPPSPWTWEQYHAPIPEPLGSQLIAEGQEWLKRWDVKYESIDFSKESLLKHLKMAPLTVVIPGHAILNFRTTSQVVHYFDTYPPFKKTVSDVIQAMKVVLYPKEQAISDNLLLVDIFKGQSGRQVEKLLNALDKLNWRLPVKRSNVFVYDDQVADLVMRFKLANTLDSKWGKLLERYLYKGREVNAWDRKIVNNLIK